MGLAYVAWIYDDSIRYASEGEKQWEQARTEVGEAVLKICLDPRMRFDERSMQFRPVKSHSIGTTGNGANLCDEVHSTDERLYLWSGNRLSPLHKLSAAELDQVASLLAEEQAARKQASQ